MTDPADYDYTTQLRVMFPGMPWDEPVLITTLDGASGYACRICIAMRGQHADAVKDLPQDPELVRLHIKQAHPS